MIANIEWNNVKYEFNLNRPIDISIPLKHGKNNPNAFFINPPKFTPFRVGNFVGSISEGGSVNCYDLLINPHGNGTHTECVGHILNGYTINQCLTTFFFKACLISVEPTLLANGDKIITLAAMQHLVAKGTEALVIRTLPNHKSKLTQQYSGNNPCYFEAEACAWMAANNIMHLITDLPSVDREEDGGFMLSHKAFWQVPQQPRVGSTITEMAYIANEVHDGLYVINLQIAPLETDASMAKPVLFELRGVLS
jgi:kynurenine formamidase